MVNVLWKCVGEEAQDIAEYAVMLAVILVIVDHPIGGFERQQCFLIGREFGPIGPHELESRLLRAPSNGPAPGW